MISSRVMFSSGHGAPIAKSPRPISLEIFSRYFITLWAVTSIIRASSSPLANQSTRPSASGSDMPPWMSATQDTTPERFSAARMRFSSTDLPAPVTPAMMPRSAPCPGSHSRISAGRPSWQTPTATRPLSSIVTSSTVALRTFISGLVR